jgi:flagellum-specific peptidoglycan hydrolase FlgJ
MSLQTDFINLVKTGAQAAQKKYGIVASVTIAQAADESGWGQHVIANNLFGIKANGYTGPCVTVSTKEFINGQYVNTVAAFRSYPSYAASIDDHGNFIATSPRYANILHCTDYTKVCQLLQQDGYATEPSYSNQLIGLIKQYNLSQYDSAAIQAPSPVAAKHVETVKQGTFYIHSTASTASGVVGIAKGGQAFVTAIVAGGWRQISFNSRTAYIGAAAFN